MVVNSQSAETAARLLENLHMEEVLKLVLTLAISLSVLLFFGPIIVIIGIIGDVQLGPLRIDLSRKSSASRLSIALVGLASWLLLYIPLISLAFKAIVTESSKETPIPILATASQAITTESPSSTPTLGPTEAITLEVVLTLTPMSTIDPTVSRGSCYDSPLLLPCTYRVVVGDHYRQIAFKVYGNAGLAGIIADAHRNSDGTYQRLYPGDELFISVPDNVPPLPYPECGKGIFPCQYKAFKGDTYEWISQEFYRNVAYADLIRQANIDYSTASTPPKEITNSTIIVVPVRLPTP